MGSLGMRIKQAIESRGYTQGEVAKAAGMTEVSLSRYISDSREPNVSKLKAIAEVLNVSVDWLVGMPEKGFLSDERIAEIRRRESVLDGTCTKEINMGAFPRHMMVKFGLIRYAGGKGKTRIVIEYDNDTGLGWKRVVSESNIPAPRV